MSTSLDLIIRIKNGYVARTDMIDVLYSKMNGEILKILKQENYIEAYETKENDGKKVFSVTLKYEDGEPVFSDVKIISKPGRRLYTKIKDLTPVHGGMGIGILTTPKGIMTDKQARKENVGGELLFKVW